MARGGYRGPQRQSRRRDQKQVLADLDRWTREDLLAYAAEQHRLKMDAFPGLEHFPELVGMLIRYNVHWGPCNCVVGDAEGNGVLFEKSRYHYAVRMSDRNLVISTYGGCDDEDMRKMCDLTNPLFKYYQRRLGVMKEILAAAEAGDGIDGEVFWKAMLHHDAEAPGCQHRDTMPPGVELFTHVAAYTLPAEGRSFRRVMARDTGRVLYPCSVPVIETH